MKHYRQEVIHLWARQGFPGYLGLATIQAACVENKNNGVNIFLSHSLGNLPYYIAHELGLNFSIGHDNSFANVGEKL